MEHFRRQKLRDLIATKYGGDRKRFMSATGLNKARVSQLLSDRYPFGARAAKELAAIAGLPDDYFETMDSRTAAWAIQFNALPEDIKARWESLVTLLGGEPKKP